MPRQSLSKVERAFTLKVKRDLDQPYVFVRGLDKSNFWLVMGAASAAQASVVAWVIQINGRTTVAEWSSGGDPAISWPVLTRLGVRFAQLQEV